MYCYLCLDLRLVPNKRSNHLKQVVEEHEEMESELDERFLLMSVQGPEDLGCIKQVLVLKDLLCVKGQKRCVQDKGDPVAVYQEQNREKGVDNGFWDDVGVETVAEIDRVDIVAFQIRVHDGEENLQKQVDGIYEHRQQI